MPGYAITFLVPRYGFARRFAFHFHSWPRFMPGSRWRGKTDRSFPVRARPSLFFRLHHPIGLAWVRRASRDGAIAGTSAGLHLKVLGDDAPPQPD